MKKTFTIRARHLPPGTAGILLTATLFVVTTTTQAQEKTADSDTATTKAASKRVHAPQSQSAVQTARAEAQNGSEGPGRTARLDRSKLFDYMSMSSKRTDMRYRSRQIGTENAYREWMERKAGRTSAGSRGQAVSDAVGKK